MDIKGFTSKLIAVGMIVAAILMGMLYFDRTAAEAVSEPPTVLFSDDFSGDLSQWSIESGVWVIDQGELVGNSPPGGGDAWIYAGDTSWTDYSMQLKVNLIAANVAIVFRSTGHLQNEYILDLNLPGGQSSDTYFLHKYQGGNWTGLGGGTSSVMLTNPFVVTIQIVDGHIWLYINGQYVDDFIDPTPLTNGRIGVGKGQYYDARFDDVLVATMPPVILLPPEQQMVAKAGETVAYSINLENNTGITDTFNLQVLPGNTWNTTLSVEQVGPISAGASITFTTWVDVPPTALPGELDNALIQATATSSPGDPATASVNTTASSGQLAYLPLTDPNGIALIDLQTHTNIGMIKLAQYGCGYPSRLRLTPDGEQLYAICESENIIVLDAASLAYITTIDRPTACGQDVVFVQSGAYAIASANKCWGDGYQIDMIDTTTYSVVQSIPTPTYIINSMIAHPSLPIVYAVGQEYHAIGPIVLVLDLDTFSFVATLPGAGSNDVEASPDGKWIYTSTYYVYKIDVNTNTVVDELYYGGNGGLALSTDGSTLYTSSGYMGEVHVIDVNKMEEKFIINVGDDSGRLTITCEGDQLYVPLIYQGVISVIDTHSNQKIYDIPVSGNMSGDGVIVCPPNLSNIYANKTVDKQATAPHEALNYNITAQNIGLHNIDSVVITDTLPVLLNYVEGSLSATSGVVDYQEGVITWTGSITTSTTVTVSFSVAVSPEAIPGTSITNRAFISAEGKTFSRIATIDVIPYKQFIPCASKACLPIFKDDFSNPASGWTIESQNGYWMGYDNGAYYIALNQGWMAWSLQDFGVSDFRIEVDTWAASAVNGSTAIMFSADNYGFYMFEVLDGYYSVWRNDAYYWQWTPLVDWTYSSAIHPGNQVNRLQVVRMGENIKVYANGQLLASVNDGTYRGTWNGMTADAYIGYFDGRFDNFILYGGDCLGAKSTGIPLNRSFDGVWMAPGSSHDWPDNKP